MDKRAETTCFTQQGNWTVWYKWSTGPKEWVIQALKGCSPVGLLHAKELRLDLGSDMVSLKCLKWKINSLQFSSARFLLKIWMCFIWDFLTPSKSHWGYHPQRLHAAFYRINRTTQNNNSALDSPSHSFRGTENLSHGAEPKMKITAHGSLCSEATAQQPCEKSCTVERRKAPDPQVTWCRSEQSQGPSKPLGMLVLMPGLGLLCCKLWLSFHGFPFLATTRLTCRQREALSNLKAARTLLLEFSDVRVSQE